MIYKCLNCGKSFYDSHKTRPRKYCCKECMYSSEEWKSKSGNLEFLKKAQEKSRTPEAIEKRRKSFIENHSKEQSELMRKQSHDYYFCLRKLESRGINMNSKGYIYIIKQKDRIKVGFTKDFSIRKHGLGSNIELIRLYSFSKAKTALREEMVFHNTHGDSSEYYSMSQLKFILQYFSNLERLIKSCRLVESLDY